MKNSENEIISKEQEAIKLKLQKYSKPVKSQIPMAILLIIALVFISVLIFKINTKLGIYWVLGLLFGYVLQRSRFCFTAVFRDPIITGSISVAKALLVAIFITSIGFFVIKIIPNLFNLNYNLNMENVYPIGLPLIIGGVLFGIGMVISGGCATGTLMRVGEGFTVQAITLIFFIIGSLWGAKDMHTFWGRFNINAPKVFLPNIFGWTLALIIQLSIIAILYFLADKWQKRTIKKELEDSEKNK